MADKVRVAIVGLGFGAEFIPIYQAHPDAEMYAICQRNQANLNQVGDSFGVKKRYADFDSTTDKVAAVGLSALIAGAAIKSGLFAKLWGFIIPLVIAGKKLLMLLVIALGGLAAKYLKKKPQPDQSGGTGGLPS